MDDILTEFVAQTHADAALAHDLLEAAEWNLDRALTMYDGFMNTQAVEPEDQISEYYIALRQKRRLYVHVCTCTCTCTCDAVVGTV